MTAGRITRLVLVERSRRILGLIGFAILFVLAGFVARLLVGGSGHVEMGQLYQIGGYPMVSALLLLGWLLGRYPIIATLVLVTGWFSADRAAGYARLYSVRPVSFLRLYGLRLLTLLAVSFVMSAVLMPTFDVLMLGEWTGAAVFVLIGSYVLLYGSLTAFLSLFTRGEGWLALGLGMSAMIWDAMRRAGSLDQAPRIVRQIVSFILPPQGPLFRIETAFGEIQPIPWIDVGYVAAYSAILLLATAVFIVDREV
ncbi:MAG: hypothetical protein WEE89_04010 [Gemmatimonadota bacterium]